MSTQKIMIVEDESIVALDLKDMLTRLGHSVVGTAASGEEAISITRQTHPNLALMDIRLQGDTDGITVAHELRAKYNVPVIYLTAYADDDTLNRAKLTEPFGYLTKPVHEHDLHIALEIALYKSQMERKLQRHVTHLQRIITDIPDGIAILDNRYMVVMANPLGEEYLVAIAGLTLNQVVTHLGDYPIEDLINRDNRRHWHEISIVAPAKRVFEVSITYVQLPEADLAGRKSEYLLVIRDVTFEREVQQRAQLQDRLAALGQFSAGIAHDFNNIISGILLSSQVIDTLERNLSPKSKGHVDSIRQQAMRAADLVRRIVDFSRKRATPTERLDLVSLIREQMKMVSPLLPETIRLEVRYPADAYWIEGDPTGIAQILMNLVLNARDAMPSGGDLLIELTKLRALETGLDLKPPTDELVRLRVADTGVGIRAALLPHIFEPFFTTKEPGKGTGLGLAQVYGLVQQYGGDILVESQPDNGAIFSVYFPSLASLPTPATPTPPDIIARPIARKATILVVEDNTDARHAIVEALEMLGYPVLAASNGREALTILDQRGAGVGLLITDVVMPEMGGLELVREIRRKKNPVKIIVMTGYASKEAETGLRPLSISAFLDKPFDLGKLTARVSEALQG